MSGALNISPIGADEFSVLMEKFAPFSGKIAVAVSGGSDSMALALCVRRWAEKECIAFIVDHDLRPDSAKEAVQVKMRLESLGMQAEILPWKHEMVTSRLHERAREARYALLLEACRRHGAENLLVAHHREDQAETILMRLAKGSGVEGLAGIKPETQREDIRVLRVFLSLSKQRLVATCTAAEIPFISDPSNESEKFARGRLRKIMPLLASEGLSTETLLDLGARAAEAHEALDYYAKILLHEQARSEIGGSLCVKRQALREAPRAVALRALSVCLRFIHDGGHPPERESLAALLDVIVKAPPETVRTLQGCIVSISENKVFFLREPSAASEILALRSGETVLWDGRWLVTAAIEAPQIYEIRAMGNPPHERVDRLAPLLRRLVPQGRVRASLPALWVGEECWAIPSFDPESPFRLSYRKGGFP